MISRGLDRRVDLPGLVFQLFFVVYCACLLGANAVLFSTADASEGSVSGGVFALSWLALSAVVILYLLFTLSQNTGTLLCSSLIAVYIIVSCFWSINPTTTFVYGMLLVANIFMAHLSATRLGSRRLVSLIGHTLLGVSMVGLCLYFAGFGPAVYLDVHDRSNLLGSAPFRGLFAHKITAGLYASVGLGWSVCMLSGLKRVLASVVFLLVVILSGSSTGLVLSVVAISVSIFVLSATSARISRLGVTLIAFVVGFSALLLVVPNWNIGLEALGRDATLTGRTDLWRLGLIASVERPVSGWGFNAYLGSEHSLQLRSTVSAFANYDIPHFHQSWIQTAVDFGVPVVLLFLYGVGRLFGRAYTFAVTHDRGVGSTVFVALAVMVVASLVMFLFISYNHFVTFFIFLFVFRFWSVQPKQLHHGG